ncbi:MAG: DEAD/DEAH box helicase family protein [Candidatus Moranbacteria bacterium]|nr:DEAD/DEAH box helicase family protein [Candidatus Moranbacteria bacterium]
MILSDYQKIAVDQLLNSTKKLLLTQGQKMCVFKSPTGSGKTIMMADFLAQLAKDDSVSQKIYIWASTNSLHEQSKEKLQKYLSDTEYTCFLFDDITSQSFEKNQIIFVNWESLTRQDRDGEWSNVAMRDNESDINLKSLVENTKQLGIEVVLIVDESHATFWSTQTQQFVNEVIDPRLIIEVSATPKIEVSLEEHQSGLKSQVTVPFDSVVESGLIKSEIIVNAEIGKYEDIAHSTDEALLAAALEKRVELARLYEKNGINVNPLLLIQLPSESQSLNALDKSVKEKVVKILEDRHGITFENGKLALWLTGPEKENLENITDNQNPVEVLIFKTAISRGWDCPRADILVMLREMQSVTFKVQTVGRILRMPEARHYDEAILNKAYLYTNVSEMNIAEDISSQKYFSVKLVKRISEYKSIDLPSVHLSRADYGDLTYKFREIFVEEANVRFGILPKDNAKTAYKKADVDLELYIEELATPVLADAVISQIDGHQEITGENVSFSVPADEIKYRYAQFAKLMSLPFAPVRSHTKIQEAIYDWFDDMLGFSEKSRLEIQRIVVCAENNQKIFSQIINSSKEEFEKYRKESLKKKKILTKLIWNIPEVLYLNGEYEEIPSLTKGAMLGALGQEKTGIYLKKNRSNPEKSFEVLLSQSEDIEWWYKNGESTKEHLGILYEYAGEDHVFYPDFVFRTKNGKVGIFETKDENDQDGLTKTKAKAEALHKWMQNQDRKDLFGGIAIERNGEWFLNNESIYNWEKCERGDWSDWKKVDF